MRKKVVNQNGMTLVEVIIGVSIFAILLVGLGMIYPQLTKVNKTFRNTIQCRAYLDDALAEIDKFGMYGKMMAIPPRSNNNINWGITNSMNPTIGDLTPQQVFPAYMNMFLDPGSSSADPTILRTPTQLSSSLTVLNSLYHRNPTICSSQVEFTAAALLAEDIFPEPSEAIENSFRLRVQMLPYDVINQTVGSCAFYPPTGTMPIPIAPAPMGKNRQVNEPEAATIIQPNAPWSRYNLADFSDSEIRQDVGFVLRLEVSFEDDDGSTKNCNAERIYTYPADLTSPVTPTVIIGQAIPTMNVADYYADNVSVIIGYVGATAGQGEMGTALMCRDMSKHDPSILPPAAMIALGKTTYLNIPSNVGPTEKYWRPCESITVCNRTPDSVTYWPDPGSLPYNESEVTNYRISLNFNDNRIPYGCLIQIDVKAVDSAGNVSTTPKWATFAVQESAPYAVEQ